MKVVREEAKRFRQTHRPSGAGQPVIRMPKTFEYTKEQLLLIRDGLGAEVPVPPVKRKSVTTEEVKTTPVVFQPPLPRPKSIDHDTRTPQAAPSCPWPEALLACMNMGFDESTCTKVLTITNGAVEAAISILADPALTDEYLNGDADSVKAMMGLVKAEASAKEKVCQKVETSPQSDSTNEVSPNVPAAQKVGAKDAKKEPKKEETPPAATTKEEKKEKKEKKPNKKKSKERRIVDLTKPPPTTTIVIPLNLFQIFVMVLLAFAVMVVVQL